MCDNGLCRFKASHRPAPSHSQSYLIKDARRMCSTELWRLCSNADKAFVSVTATP